MTIRIMRISLPSAWHWSRSGFRRSAQARGFRRRASPGPRLRSAGPRKPPRFAARSSSVPGNRPARSRWCAALSSSDGTWETDYDTAATANAGAERLVIRHRATGLMNTFTPGGGSVRGPAAPGGACAGQCRRHSPGRVRFFPGRSGPGVSCIGPTSGNSG